MDGTIIIVLVLFAALCIYALVYGHNQRQEYHTIKEASRTIEIGMPLEQVLEMLGNKYSLSHLKNGVDKYEWKIQEKGSSSSVNGVRTYTPSRTYKLTVKVKEGKVIETKSLNLE